MHRMKLSFVYKEKKVNPYNTCFCIENIYNDGE